MNELAIRSAAAGLSVTVLIALGLSIGRKVRSPRADAKKRRNPTKEPDQITVTLHPNPLPAEPEGQNGSESRAADLLFEPLVSDDSGPSGPQRDVDVKQIIDSIANEVKVSDFSLPDSSGGGSGSRDQRASSATAGQSVKTTDAPAEASVRQAEGLSYFLVDDNGRLLAK